MKLIAEIGWNHLGDMSLAKNMIESAFYGGADYAKFQTWSVSRLKAGEWDYDGRRELYNKSELTKDQHIELINHCNMIGINFLSSVFSIKDAELLKSLNCESVKIPSFESRNVDLIKYCNDNFKTVFMSTGTSSIEEVKESLLLFNKCKVYLMHCVSVYPCSYEIANLPKMFELQKIHNLVGYSDHIEGIESAKIAIGFGAQVIEKHFTIDKELPGRDNKFAILPENLKELKTFIVNREKMLIYHGSSYLELESNARKNYSGRFNA